ncbi:MAG: SH3 domain-containing protein [Caldilineaceae bacterium SB0664_bin_27]|uniref:SH3 domain-containing protein n=1 Tax=Caldilineaceae bacterium SB0664_bin_27 TaxID=2605260 RepID=A0A6B0YZF5_9CHLR|nr:SH3 domain-containing protein [Caldilineaceae bacterium SB0664_bin_27]
MKRQTIIVIAALALVVPGVLMAQGDLTLEGLSAQVEGLAAEVAGLFTTQDDLAQRLAAVETAIVPTPTATATTTATTTATHTATASPSPTAQLPDPSLTIQRRMNIRRGPGTQHGVLGTAEAGTEFNITGKNLNGDWWQIDYEGQAAWVYASYVTASYADDVQVVPTPTPIPTATSKPTSTPTPDVLKEYAYRASIGEIFVSDWGIAESMELIGDLFIEAGENPLLMLSDDWKTRVGIAMAALKVAYEDIQGLTPPENLKRFHDLTVDALSYCDAAIDQLAAGIDNFDIDSLEVGAGLLDLCSEKLDLAVNDPNW